ncbi:MAG TPA: 4-alpha-glucanotransferase [Steroidobacteraceae bacterium]|nr:4-alpha-glucanotransferase [Steroidobacteraceae bacterium]
MRLPVLDRRRAGVLLHLGSLEAPLGRGGRAFIDWLADGGFSVWQILPAGPTGADGSPYWVRSDFAGNPAFLDPTEPPGEDPAEYAAFLDQTQHWLDDYALFEVLSGVHAGEPWWTWPAELRDRTPSALARVTHDLPAQLHRIKREQFVFFVQWRRLRAHARARGVRIVGDLPFYVGPHSAATWAHRGQFQLEADGRPAAVAGVPPDYFSQTGQLWGNPLYDWQAMRRDNFAYWRARVLEQLERVDLLRIDHFRALAAHWAVPAGAADARAGAWHLTPGEDLLRLLMDDLGDLPIVAEDLGVITDDVVALRKGFGLAGMRVLQFAFSGEGDNPHLPHMHEHDSIVYTGTHDNDTTLGWYRSLDEETRRSVDAMLRAAPGSMPDALIREALGSVGQLAVIPVQDLLALGSDARLNTPGTVQGNWSWRLPAGALTAQLASDYARLNRMYGRA